MRRRLAELYQRLRYATDTAGVCTNGHGGHQHDARYCRICGSVLHNRKEPNDG